MLFPTKLTAEDRHNPMLVEGAFTEWFHEPSFSSFVNALKQIHYRVAGPTGE